MIGDTRPIICWQSTLFAIAAGLVVGRAVELTGAQIRYWVWFSASLKFFVPFALLMSAGSRLEWAPAAKQMAAQGISSTMVQITRPFPRPFHRPSAPSRGTDKRLAADGAARGAGRAALERSHSRGSGIGCAYGPRCARARGWSFPRGSRCEVLPGC